MFKITSADRRAKTLKWLEGFERDVERVRARRGARAAAWYFRTYRSQVAAFRRQIAAYDRLRTRGLPPLRNADIGAVGPYLVDARIASGLTQRELAARLGVSQPMVFKYEQAEYRDCGTQTLVRAMDALGVSSSVTLRATGAPRPAPSLDIRAAP